MGIIDQAIKDVATITGDANGFGVPITFLAPGGQTATIIGKHTKHHLDINDQGVAVNSKKASIEISEQLLINAGYPIRNSDHEVSLTGHKITVTDSTGRSCQYIIQTWFPDETIGLIVIILSDFKA